MMILDPTYCSSKSQWSHELIERIAMLIQAGDFFPASDIAIVAFLRSRRSASASV
jgi:hypothetical protein